MFDPAYFKWLTESAYGRRKVYTGTSPAPRGYIKNMRFQYRKMRSEYLKKTINGLSQARGVQHNGR